MYCMYTTTMMFLYRQGKCNAPIKYGVKTMNKVIVDIVNDFELKNIGCKISQPKKCFRFQLFELVQVFGWRYLAEKMK